MDISKHRNFLLSEIRVNAGPLNIGSYNTPTVINNKNEVLRLIQTIGKDWKSGYPGHYNLIDFNKTPFNQTKNPFIPFYIWKINDDILDWSMIED